MDLLPILAGSSADAAPGAGGAPLSEVIWGTVAGLVLAALAFAVGRAYRRGRLTLIDRLADASARYSGLPRWAALPSLVTHQSLQLALVGFWWDVATHIDSGRDEGPFGNVAHWPILIGLAGLVLGGFLAILIGSSRRDPTAVRIGPGWYAPLGGVLIVMSGAFALSGFPLDDTWHRLFGQDVTLWGPTHVLMIGSASFATIGAWILHQTAGDDFESRRDRRLVVRMRNASFGSGFLIALCTLQGEFDFGVPQFALVLHPVMLALAAGAALVVARIVLGPGGALKSVAIYLVVRAALTALIGPGLGHSTMHFPLFVAEAVLVELAAWRLGRERPLRLGLVAGGLVGTLGLAAEWGWTHVWMPMEWSPSLLPEVALLGPAAGLAGGVLGAYIGATLRTPPSQEPIGPAWAAAAAGAVAVACIALPLLPLGGADPVRAQVELREAAPAPERTVHATLRLEPRDAAEGADWLKLIAWQGGGLHRDDLRRVETGVYETTEPVPVHGTWKALVGLAEGRTMRGVPIYLPADPAIPAAAVPARDREQELVPGKQILQREATTDGGLVELLAYLVLLAIVAVELAVLAWGLRRVRLAQTGRLRAPGAPAGGAEAHAPAAEPAAATRA